MNRKNNYEMQQNYTRCNTRKECLVALVSFGKDSTNRLSIALNRLKVNYKLVSYDMTPTFIPTHIILSGGPKHVYDSDHYIMPQWVIDAKVPVLGICYGMQLIAHTFRGTIRQMPEKEEGLVEITEMINGNQITSGRWMNRNDRVFSVPPNFHVNGVTSRNHIASFTDYNKWWAVQYHPESVKYGDLSVFRRFFNEKYV